MANTFTAIIPNMTTAFQRIASEAASLAKIAQTDFKAEEAALNEVVIIPINPVVVGDNRTPAAIFTVAADRAIDNTSITITKDRKFPFHLTGDDMARMRQNPEFVAGSILQAMRAARNEIHSDLAGLHIDAAGYYRSGYSSSGAAVGTALTTPFGSTIDLLVDAKKLLNDSLAPKEERFCMLDTSAEAALSKLGQLIKANEAGSDELLRQGIVGKLAGFNLVVDNDVKLHTKGTGTGYVINDGAGIAVGATVLTVNTGSGTILPGDVISFATVDTVNKYVVLSTVGGSTVTSITLTSPVITALTNGLALVISGGRRNMAFHREALGLAIRLPKLPKEGDAGEHQVIIDPISGLGFRFSTYKGYGLNNYELSVAWGVKTVRKELLKLILG